MQGLSLSVRLFGRAVWTALLESLTFEYPQKDAFLAKLHSLEALRKQAEYDTGSISTTSAWCLHAAVRNFQPEVILEVGTFIGKSTIAMGLALDVCKRPGTIHTCDFSNSMPLPALCKSPIVQYPKTSSSDMITAMLAKNMAGTVDFLHLDGRLSDEDVKQLAILCKPDAVFAFDDFEGIEKGIANYKKTFDSGLFPGRVLIPPCAEDLSHHFGFFDGSRTALWVPIKFINLTAQ